MNFDVVYKKRVEIPNLEQLVSQLVHIVGNEKWVSTEEADLVAYSKDYQLITNRWMMEGVVPGLPHVIVWPETEEQISKILLLANEKKIPVIPYGEGSGVVGAAIPVYGGIMVDLKRMTKIIEVNEHNLTVTVQCGANGKWLERELTKVGYLIGHVPQSFYSSTVGGWIAHRAAGQFSTKYGKIEDIVLSMRIVLPTGEIVNTKLYPRASDGPQIERLFLSSEGTLGIVTQATMKMWPLPKKQAGIAFIFNVIEDSLKATRLILQKQIYPAVIRIYDKAETERHFYIEPKANKKVMVIFVCEAPIESLVDLEISEIKNTCSECKGIECGKGPVVHWFDTRFTVNESSIYIPKGQIMDTVEVSCMWDKAEQLYHSVIGELSKVEGILLASGHASHFYPNGVCFYFSFSGVVPDDQTPEEFFKLAWEAVMIGTLQAGGSISHHHGIGINRARWMREEHGPVLDLMKKIKHVIDPKGIMNPGKLYEETERE